MIDEVADTLGHRDMGLATTTSSDDSGDVVYGDAASSERGRHGTEAPTGQLVAATMGERCVTCGAPFASDQRYCVNCGERRGKARFSFASLAAPQPAAPPAPPPPRRQRRASSGATLVAGIGTLLLAMGVGVLIGHNGNANAPQRAAAPYVVRINGGGAAAATTPTATTAATSSSKSRSSAKVIKPKKKPTPTKVVQQKAAAAASKVLGGANISNPTTKVGAKGSGPGYQGGKFTGGFFGP